MLTETLERAGAPKLVGNCVGCRDAWREEEGGSLLMDQERRGRGLLGTEQEKTMVESLPKMALWDEGVIIGPSRSAREKRKQIAKVPEDYTRIDFIADLHAKAR